MNTSRLSLKPLLIILSLLSGFAFATPAKPVQIYTFLDFQCPFSKAHVENLTALKIKYGSRIQIDVVNFPLTQIHPKAREAAAAALCFNDSTGHWDYLRALFRMTESNEKFRTLAVNEAVSKGLNQAEFEACLDAPKIQTMIDAEIKTGNDVRVANTPTTMIGNETIEGAQPIERFVDAIERALRNQK